MPAKLSRSPTQKTEENLSQQLKDLCSANGKEKNPKESAVILHKLGLLYKARCHNKVCLAQSAVLLNAAIVRKPDNAVEMRKDLESLCALVVKMAGVKKSDVDLVSASKTCKNAIIQHRIEAKEALSNLPHIPNTKNRQKTHKLETTKIRDVQRIQNAINENYSAVMSYLSDYCLSIMGDPPGHCRFALVGMGPLARKEVTPYSPFENVIVLEEGTQLKENYPEIIEYFRWFAIIFQIIVINMGETIVPSVAIRTLNDSSKPNGNWFSDAYTPQGISFDGLVPHSSESSLHRSYPTVLNPWANELIQPASEMANYLDEEQILKNGYRMADVLSKTCFVSGDRHVYQDFSARSAGKLTSLRESYDGFTKELRQQVNDNKLKFDVNENCPNLYTASKFNLKCVIYRSTTVFISALGTFHGMEELSCFDIIDKLKEKGIVTAKEGHYLQYAVAIACETRLKICLKKQRQPDLVEDHPNLGKQLAEILQAVGGKCVADYFTIARAFQTAMSGVDFDKAHTPLPLHLEVDYRYSVDICCKLHLHETCVQICSSMLKNSKKTLSAEDKASCHYYVGVSLLDLEKPLSAQKQFEKELFIRRKMSTDGDNAFIADCHYNLGRCFVLMTKYEKALCEFEQELGIRKKLTDDETVDTDIAFCVQELGSCLLNLNKKEEALIHLQNALNIRRKTVTDHSSNIRVAYCLSQVGLCLMKLKRYSEALSLFQEELEVRKKMSKDEDINLNIAKCMDRMGICLINLEKYELALSMCEQSLSIHNRAGTNKETNVAIATCKYNLSICKNFIDQADYHRDSNCSH